jgi:hypothetical protein
VTGHPGIGKSTLAYLVARELRLGRVLHWGITSRSNLRSGLYQYDAIGRTQASLERSTTTPVTPEDSAAEPCGRPRIGHYVRLGPLGTTLLPYKLPRILLIDELDKNDIDLLNVLEEGEFDTPDAKHPAQPDTSIPRPRHPPPSPPSPATTNATSRPVSSSRHSQRHHGTPPTQRPACTNRAAQQSAHNHANTRR